MQAAAFRRIISKSRRNVTFPQRILNDARLQTSPHQFQRKLHHVSKVSTSNGSGGSHQRRFVSKMREPASQIPDLDDEYIDDYMMDGKDIKTAEDMDFYDALTDEYFPSDEVDEIKEAEEEEARRQGIRDELDSRKGRLWQDPWEITDDDWSSGKAYDDLPDWTEELCSRVSLERVKIFPEGVPTLTELARTPLPSSPPPHPALGNPAPYLKYRKNMMKNHIRDAVVQFAEPKVRNILEMKDWDEKQAAIDELFEEVVDALKSDGIKDKDDDLIKVVIGSQPKFPQLVEKALEEYLQSVVRNEKQSVNGEQESGNTTSEVSTPIFMDFMKVPGSSLDKDGVPKLLYPLKSHAKHGPGRMVEEWELAANEKTRRIMHRECISKIAKAMTDSTTGCARVVVTGNKGVGKSASLAAIVASARLSGHIVLYLPDGDRLRKHGFYIEPNSHRCNADGSKMFDLPILSQEVCEQLLTSHKDDFDDIIVSKECIEKMMSGDQLKKLDKMIAEPSEDGSISLQKVLEIGSDRENTSLSASCYSAAIETLMNQESKQFTIVADQFNCYFDHGHYFHEEYDSSVRRAIPSQKITLFQPILHAFGVEKSPDGEVVTSQLLPMKRTTVIAGVTESHAVPKQITESLTDKMIEVGVTSVAVPQYSPIEVEHILANFEITGIGRLRFDRGETVMNSQEVSYLRMISGGVGQNLLDACIQ